MQSAKLLKLAAYLKTVPPKRFKLDEWGNKVNPNECSAVACACGHATVAFPRSNFKLVIDTMDGEPFGDPYIQYKNQNGIHHSWNAVEEFFSINSDQALHLFSEDSYESRYKGPKSVAKRIEKFVEANGKIPVG